jgi:hypothetical protein
MQRNDFRGMLAALGETAAATPVHDAFDATLGVHRAHAWEKLGRTDVAVRELKETMERSASTHASVERIALSSKMCPQSFPLATGSPISMTVAAISSIALGSIAALGVLGTLVVAGYEPWAPYAAFGGAAAAAILFTLGGVAYSRRSS